MLSSCQLGFFEGGQSLRSLKSLASVSDLDVIEKYPQAKYNYSKSFCSKHFFSIHDLPFFPGTCHLLRGRPSDRLLSCGYHSLKRDVQRLSAG